MKKIVAMMLALVLVLSMASVAWAADGDPAPATKTAEDSGFTENKTNVAADSKPTITINKGYVINDSANATGITNHPADDPTFSVDKTEYYVNGKKDTTVTVPTLGSITTKGVTEGTFDAQKAVITIKLPTYTKVGEYAYYLKEAAPTSPTAGVTYNYTDGSLILKVTVINEFDTDGKPTGKLLIGGIALRQTNVNAGNANNSTEKLDKDTGDKDNVHNEYEAGKLTVDKTVTGNMGDTSKPWVFKAEFTPKAGETVRGTITFDGNGTYYGTTQPTINADTGVVTGTASTDKSIAASWNSKQTVYFTLTSGQTFIFNNIPRDVTYTITELEADSYGYTTTKTGDTGTMTKDAAKTASFVNNKSQTPDTGVSVTMVPYLMILAVVMVGAAMMIIRRRKEEM